MEREMTGKCKSYFMVDGQCKSTVWEILLAVFFYERKCHGMSWKKIQHGMRRMLHFSDSSEIVM